MKVNNNYNSNVYLMLKAVGKVKAKYVEYKDGAGNLHAHIERVFAYEFYRQWANILDDRQNNPQKLSLNAEIIKGFNEETDIIDDVETKKKICYPDMVLHRSQTDYENNEIVCEIKVLKNLTKDNLVADLTKLSCFVKKGALFNHPYKIGVFLLVGGTLSDISALLADSIIQNIPSSNKILLVAYKPDIEPETTFLSNLY